MKKILISDSIDKKCSTILQSYGYEVTYKPGMTPDQIKSEITNYNGLINYQIKLTNNALIQKFLIW